MCLTFVQLSSCKGKRLLYEITPKLTQHTRGEVVKAMRRGANPFTQVFGISQGRTEAHNADWSSLRLNQLAADGAHAGHNHLQHAISLFG